MTGWGQDGPLAQAAGHDINYIALAGALHAIGRAGERAGAAAQPRRRLRRRRHAAGVRHDVRAARGPRSRARARWSTPRWSTAAALLGNDARVQGASGLAATSAARTCSTAARTSTTPTRLRRRQVRRDRRDRAAVLRRAARESCGIDDRGLRRAARRQPRWPVLKQPPCRRVPHPHARRVVRAARGHRRLLRAGARLGRGARSIRTTRRAAPSSRSMACCSRRRRRASAARRPQRPAPHAAGADTEAVLRDAGFSPEQIAELRAAGALA